MPKSKHGTTMTVTSAHPALYRASVWYWETFLWYHQNILRGRMSERQYLWAIGQLKADERDYQLENTYRARLESDYGVNMKSNDFLPEL